MSRHLFLFGFPLSLAMGLQACFNLVDLYIIGKLPQGKEAIAALVTCDLIAVVGTILVQGVSNASVAIISRFFGRDDRQSLNHATWNSFLVVLILSALFGAIGFFGAEILIGDMVGSSGQVRSIAVSYLRILVGHSWTIFFLVHLTAVMRAIGDAKWPSIILIGANILNLLLDVLFVYGPGPAPAFFSWGTELAGWLGVPRMGVDGAAWATVLARGLGCVVALILLVRRASGPRLILAEMRPRRGELFRIVRLGAPSSAQFLLRIGVVLVAVALVTRRFTSPDDATVLAGFSICIRLDMLALFQGLGWASAAATFVGANLGASQPERASRAGWAASWMNAVAMSLLAAVFLTQSREIVSWFSDHEAVVTVAQEYLQIVAGTYAFIGIAVVISHALQGAADTITSFVIDALIILGVQIPLLLILTLLCELPRTSIWYTIAGANVLSALAYAVWYRRGGWTSKQL